jgi:tRNA A-37 threonylcarbamoyl transferase component Bud32
MQFRQTLKELHKAGICHGDVRKDNMCDLDGRASFIDFDRAFDISKDADCLNEEQRLENILARY